MKGKHEHDSSHLEDYFTARYAKGKVVDAHLRLDERKKKRSATFDLSYPAGQTYPARDVKINADYIEKVCIAVFVPVLPCIALDNQSINVLFFRLFTPR